MCSSGSRMCSGKLMPTTQTVRAVHDHLRASANQVWTWYAFTFYEQLHIISSAGPSITTAIVLFTRLNSKYPLYLRRLSGNFQVRTPAGTNHFLDPTLTCETIVFHLFPFLLFLLHIQLSPQDRVCQSFLAIKHRTFGPPLAREGSQFSRMSINDITLPTNGDISKPYESFLEPEDQD